MHRYSRLALFLSLSLGVSNLLAAQPSRPRPEASFIRVSPRDTRYFELSSGRPYIPIGLNMIAPPSSDEEQGFKQMEEWMQDLHENGGNFFRIWLSNGFFDVEHEKSGFYDPAMAKRIDRVLDMAARNELRVKLTLEHFRHFFREEQKWAAKPLHHVSQGGPAADESDFFSGQASREQFKRKLDWFAGRYGSNPTVFAWELWNEINAVRGQGWEDWTAVMLGELHTRFPKNLVTQSLGSFDTDRVREKYRWLALLPKNDFAQVHRYLDLGASLEICHGPVDRLAADAVKELLALNPGKPVILAESGAVEPRHTGPFKLYAKDKAGIILHDVLFAPFFAGAAGAGQIWHWDQYVAANNLWFQFRSFAEAVRGIDPPAEDFRPVEISHDRLTVRALDGRKTILIWCRDKANNWTTELANGQPPEILPHALLGLAPAIRLPGKARVLRFYDPWTDKWSKGETDGTTVVLPAFSRSLVVKIER